MQHATIEKQKLHCNFRKVSRPPCCRGFVWRKMALAKMKAGVKSSLFGYDVSSKTSPLCHILLGFVGAGWSWCFHANYGAPFLEWAVGARSQSSQLFSIVGLKEAKLQQTFAREFPQVPNLPKWQTEGTRRSLL